MQLDRCLSLKNKIFYMKQQDKSPVKVFNVWNQ